MIFRRTAARGAVLWGVAVAAVFAPVVCPRAAEFGSSRDGIDVGPVSFCVDPDWPPYERIDEHGAHEGIAADLLSLVALRSGVRLRLVATKNWEDSIAASQRGDCSLLSFLNQTPKRDEWLVFTDPIFIDSNAIITREDHSFVDDLGALGGETLALPEGTSIEERVRQDFPNLRIVKTESESQAFGLVSSRKADLTIRSLTVAVYAIKKDGWFNLKVSGQVPGYENRLRIGVRKEDAAIRDILNRGVATITPQERREIANRHTSLNVLTRVDYGPMRNVAVAFSLILCTSLFWAVKLKRVNDRLRIQSMTDNLTGLANRLKLNERLEQECDRARRYGEPLSIVLFDLDHFKSVNDDFGHLKGDKVLEAFARLLDANCRDTDTAGRWGGEEFVLLCPGIGGAGAVILAERICDATRQHDFETGRPQTLSAGVAEWTNGDTPESLTHRADAALYRVKANGRDAALMD